MRPNGDRSRLRAGVTTLLLGFTALLAWQAPAARSVPADDPAAPAPLPAALAEAIRQGDAERVGTLLRDGATVNARDAAGNTPLILAALYARPDCVELLLKHGADPNAANKAGATALTRAATDPEKVRVLLAAGAKAGVRTELGNTPLILAARRHDNGRAVKLLLDHGADVKVRNKDGVSAMLAAAASGDPNTVQLLLDKGADVNDFPASKSPVDDFAAGMRTPLMWAAFQNELSVVRLLLSRGADPNKATAFGTPLTQAAWHDSLEAARLLSQQGVKVDARDFIGFTPLHWAAATDEPYADLVRLLLAKGADPNATGGDPIDAFLGVPQTPLMLAAKRGRTVVVEALTAAGAKAPSAEPARAARPPRPLPDALEATHLTAAAERAVAALQVTAAKSRETFLRHARKQDCVSCHQQYLPMAAVGHARERSLRLDTDAARAQIELVRRDARKDMETALQTVFHPEPVYSYGYEAFARASEKVSAGTETDALVHALVTLQAPDGCWHMNLPRPPIQSGDVGATALAILTLKTYGWPGRQDEFAAAIARGRHWLQSLEAATNEDAVFQLLGLHWAGEPAAKLAGLAKALVARQRPDGGWSQLPTLGSDAYATGQALYALARAANLSVTDRAWQRGLRFLLATQHDDGTWYATRRAFPFQPTMASGFPHGRDSWLSASATSWAVLALTQAIEPRAAAAAPSATPPVPPAPPRSSGPAPAVDFVKHIKPLLERSCLSCHGPERPRSQFRVDSRTTLLAGGVSGEAAIVPGHSDRSPLLRCVNDSVAGLEMPPPAQRERFPALTPDEFQLLRAWIDQGATWPADVGLSPPQRR